MQDDAWLGGTVPGNPREGAPVATIWLVKDSDYDHEWIVAAYDSETVANEHADRAGLSVERVDVLRALSPDAHDTRAERAAAAERARIEYQKRQEQDAAAFARTQALTISDITTRGGSPSLCHCVTFSSDSCFVTPNGYCRYCGGWTIQVFRQHLGEDALSVAIDKLAEHQRVKMREIAR